jgi:hypothetical protein
MGKARIIVFQSSLSADECRQRLRSNTDEQQRTLFSLSGYQGTRPVLSLIQGEQFQLQKRRYYRNDFAPNFYGTIRPWGNNARVEGYFGPPRWTMRFLWVWIGAAVLFTLPMGLIFLRRLPNDGSRAILLVLTLLVPLMVIAFGLLLPRFGDWLGRNEKTFLLQFLETTLAAREAPTTEGLSDAARAETRL